MKFTVDTDKEIITLRNSFTFQQLLDLKEILPKEWRKFKIQLESVYSNYAVEGEIVWIAIPHPSSYSSSQPLKQLPNPPYPIVPYRSECCGNCTACPFAGQVTCFL